MLGLDEVIKDIESIDGKEWVSQQLVSFLLFTLKLIHDLEVDVFVVDFGDEAAD